MLLSRVFRAATMLSVALTGAAQAHEAPQLHAHMAGLAVYPAVVLALAGMIWAAAPLVAGAVGHVRRRRPG
jgi:hypothetical protein